MPIQQNTDKDDVKVKGDDGTITGKLIGAVLDCLKVHVCNFGSGANGCYTSMVYEDMNASTGGVARGTDVTLAAWTQVYLHSGSGVLHGFNLTTEEDVKNFLYRLTVDGSVVFEFDGSDLTEANGYGMKDNSGGYILGVLANGKVFYFQPKHLPICFNTSVKIELRKRSGGDREFRSGVVLRSA